MNVGLYCLILVQVLILYAVLFILGYMLFRSLRPRVRAMARGLRVRSRGFRGVSPRTVWR